MRNQRIRCSLFLHTSEEGVVRGSHQTSNPIQGAKYSVADRAHTTAFEWLHAYSHYMCAGSGLCGIEFRP